MIGGAVSSTLRKSGLRTSRSAPKNQARRRTLQLIPHQQLIGRAPHREGGIGTVGRSNGGRS